MKTTTLQLLPTTSYGTPSGNYDGSSQDWSGEDQQAANYYGGFGGLQTVAFFLNNFQGKIKIEATLDSAPAHQLLHLHTSADELPRRVRSMPLSATATAAAPPLSALP